MLDMRSINDEGKEENVGGERGKKAKPKDMGSKTVAQSAPDHTVSFGFIRVSSGPTQHPHHNGRQQECKSKSIPIFHHFHNGRGDSPRSHFGPLSSPQI